MFFLGKRFLNRPKIVAAALPDNCCEIIVSQSSEKKLRDFLRGIRGIFSMYPYSLESTF